MSTDKEPQFLKFTDLEARFLRQFRRLAHDKRGNEHSRSLLELGRDREGADIHRIGRGRNLGEQVPYPFLGKWGCDSFGIMMTPDGKLWRCPCRQEQIGTAAEGVWRDKFRGVNLSDEVGCSQRNLPLALCDRLFRLSLELEMDHFIRLRDAGLLTFGEWVEADGMRVFVPRPMTDEQCLEWLFEEGLALSARCLAPVGGEIKADIKV